MKPNRSTTERTHPCGIINTGLVGATVRLAANGDDAREAIEALATLIESGFGET